MRLLDRVLREKDRVYRETCIDMLARPVRFEQMHCVLADNVAEYYFAGNDQEYWHLLKDFPNVAPPFPETFVEYAPPKVCHSKEFGTRENDFTGRIGVAISAFSKNDAMPDLTSESVREQINELMPSDRWMRLLHEAPNSWVLRLMIFAESGGRMGVPTFIWNLVVQENGTPLPLGGQDAACSFVSSLGHTPQDDADVQQRLNDLMPLFHVALLTFCFMHCRNVRVSDVSPPPKLVKAVMKRHGGSPLVKYHVLDIEPMKTVLRSERNSETLGFKKALHICRGHFRHYDNRGLFGRYKGTFWVPMHTRGSTEEGSVKKDYRMKVEEQHA